jgi:riboflavin kinase/FMN adenylyltransferase
MKKILVKFKNNFEVDSLVNKKSIAAIGNFDGIHKGHQKLLKLAKDEAKKRKIPFSIITFDPHPREFFSNKELNFKILDGLEKERQMINFGVDYYYVLSFDEFLRNLEPVKFIEKILKNFLKIEQLWAGENFRFGKNRSGSLVDSKDIFEEFSIEPKICHLKKNENQEIYSSQILRETIKNSNFDKVSSMLGRPWGISGKVEYGKKNGRTIGFPTANIHINNIVEPKYGVYVTNTLIMTNDGKKPQSNHMPSISNFGIRPTIGGNQTIFETHLLNNDGINLYGKRLYVEIGKFLRSEKKFHSLNDLKQQIKNDVKLAKKNHNIK